MAVSNFASAVVVCFWIAEAIFVSVVVVSDNVVLADMVVVANLI
jgi:hypothetical protein